MAERDKSFLEEHLTLVLTLALFIYFAVSVTALGLGRSRSFEVIRRADPSQVLVAAFVSLLPVLALLFAAVLFASSNYWPGGVALLLGAVIASPIKLAPVVVLSALALWKGMRDGGVRGRLVAGLLIGVLLVESIIFQGVWLPIEMVETKDGRVEVAYVVDEDSGGFTTILHEADFAMEKIHVEDIIARTVCRISNRRWWDDSIIELTRRPARLPHCNSTDTPESNRPSDP